MDEQPVRAHANTVMPLVTNAELSKAFFDQKTIAQQQTQGDDTHLPGTSSYAQAQVPVKVNRAETSFMGHTSQTKKRNNEHSLAPFAQPKRPAEIITIELD